MALAVAAHRDQFRRMRSLIDPNTNEDLYSHLPAFRELEALPKQTDIQKSGILFKVRFFPSACPSTLWLLII
eukprot:774705-Rhodomonas_salina.2